MYFVNTFDVCVKQYSLKFPKLQVLLPCFGGLYCRIGLSGRHRYLVHTTHQVHAVFLIKSLKFGVGEAKYSTTRQVTKVVQTRISLQITNGDHSLASHILCSEGLLQLARLRELLLQITNQKCARNVKRTIKTSGVALFLVPFATLDALIDCEFPLTHELHFFDCFSFRIICVHDCHLSFYSRLRCNPVLTGQLHQDRVPVLAWPYIILKSIQTRSRFCWAIEQQ